MKLKHKILAIFFCAMVSSVGMPKNAPNTRPKKHKISHTKKASVSGIVTHVTLTCYQPVRSQCDNNPLVTSDGSKINLSHLKKGQIKYCAISRDLLYLFSKDSPRRIIIEGYGIYEVKDVMNKRFRHSVDILIHPKDSRMIMKQNVKIKILK